MVNVDKRQAGGSTRWQGGIHYEDSQRNDSVDILQAKDYIWKEKQCTTLRSLQVAARYKRETPVWETNRWRAYCR